jgi:hypothetical protein
MAYLKSQGANKDAAAISFPANSSVQHPSGEKDTTGLRNELVGFGRIWSDLLGYLRVGGGLWLDLVGFGLTGLDGPIFDF